MPLPRGTFELRSTGPNLIPVLATRCLYQGCTSELRSNRPNLVPVLATRCLYWRGTFELRSTGPNLVPVLATRCLYWGYTSDLSAKRTSENLNTLCISCFASQRSFLRKTNKHGNNSSTRYKQLNRFVNF